MKALKFNPSCSYISRISMLLEVDAMMGIYTVLPAKMEKAILQYHFFLAEHKEVK